MAASSVSSVYRFALALFVDFRGLCSISGISDSFPFLFHLCLRTYSSLVTFGDHVQQRSPLPAGLLSSTAAKNKPCTGVEPATFK